MPKIKKKRNKKHKPIEVKTNTIDWAIAGVFTFPTETQREIMKEPEKSFKKMREGIADRDDWNLLCQAFNVAEALCGLHIGDNLLEYFNRGHDALHQIALRMMSGKSSTCYAHELTAITEALEMYEIQLRLCTQAEFWRAIQKVRRYITSGNRNDVTRIYQSMNKELAA